MPQNNPFPPAINPSGVQKPLQVSATGALITQAGTVNPSGAFTAPNVDSLGNTIVSQGSDSSLNITAATVVKATPGRLVKISVLVAGAVGSANDCAATGDAAAANKIAVIPAAVGQVILDWPCAVGITITPGAAQVVSVSYL